MMTTATAPRRMESPTHADRGHTTTTQAISQHLQQQIGQRMFDMWFQHSTSMHVSGESLSVAAENQYVADWIASHFDDALQNAARTALGESATVTVQIDPGPAPVAVIPATPISVPATIPQQPASAQHAHRGSVNNRRDRNRRADLHLPIHKRFDDFVVGTSNELAYAGAMRMAEHDDAAALGPLFLYSECGLGKTHLLQSLCGRFLDRFPGARARYTTCELFTNEYIQAVRAQKLDEFRERVRNLELLAIDDVHFLCNKTGTQNEFLNTLEAIAHSGARVAMASDEHPRELRQVKLALISRFLSGMVVHIDRPDRDLRIALVKRLARDRGLRLNQHAVEKLASHCVGSVRDIEGALNKLKAIIQLLPGASVDDEIGVIAIDRLLQTEAASTRPVRIADVLNNVCERFKVTLSELLGKGRHRRVVMARSVAAYLAHEMTTMSFPEIGRAFGRTTHSTVLTAAARVRKLLDTHSSVDCLEGDSIRLAELLDQLRHQIAKG
ncbi:MAG: chromosomal replication initiator protein DnaA [Phycisphaerales bacterium]